MPKLVAKTARLLARWWNFLASEIRKINIRFQNPACKFGSGVAIEGGVFIRVIGEGQLRIGVNTLIKRGAVIVVKDGVLEIGDHGFIGWGTVICANERISIGDNALIAEHVSIRDQNHGIEISGEPFRRQPLRCQPISIHENVWIGAKATILQGCELGCNSVVAANAVVNRSFDPNSVVGGIPARLLKQLES
ncbi:MAG: acyltransferase [Planctomycetota bacterium]